MFNAKVPQTEGGHPVPVSNFMNAQCKSNRDRVMLLFRNCIVLT